MADHGQCSGNRDLVRLLDVHFVGAPARPPGRRSAVHRNGQGVTRLALQFPDGALQCGDRRSVVGDGDMIGAQKMNGISLLVDCLYSG
jgi:hypothetical protein